jgi:outer membrane protein OmpA-like peptidoglycan-associated protein
MESSLRYSAQKGDTLLSIVKEHYIFSQEHLDQYSRESSRGDTLQEAVAKIVAEKESLAAQPSDPLSAGQEIGLDPYLFVPISQKSDKGKIVITSLRIPRQKSVINFIEIEDSTFHHGSAVPCITEKNNLLGTIADTLAYAHKYPERSIAILGHTATPADIAEARQLSEQRAGSVKAILDNDEPTFGSIAEKTGTIADLQLILNSLTDVFGWNCKAGTVDGKAGPNTREAIRKFQKSYNSKFKPEIKETGEAGKDTWTAVFKVYQSIINELCKSDGTNLSIVRMNFNYDKTCKGLCGCGDAFPIEKAPSDSYASKQNRRVEIVFLNKMQQDMIQPPRIETEPATIDNVRVFDAEQAKLFPLQKSERKNADEPPITIPWFIDCHMHINSGHCTPIPLARERIGEASGILKGVFHHQWSMDLGSKIKPGRDFSALNAMSTDKVGAAAIEHSKAVLNDASLKVLGPTEKRRRVLINLPMDMDYGWYGGYEGKEIYYRQEGKKERGYWDSEKSSFVKLSKNDDRAYESYRTQLLSIKTAFESGNGNLLSFFGFDPRRWQNNPSFPFENCLVQTADPQKMAEAFPAIGFKLYTALGFKPCDPKLPFLSAFYKRCSTRGNEIPIICHGSMNGMDTHDIHVYYNKEFNKGEPYSAALQRRLKDEYFYPLFVSPYAWERVLMDNPNLCLCLAHFAGEHFWDITSTKIDEKRREFIKQCWNDLEKPDPQKRNWIKCLLEYVEDFDNFYIDISYFIFKDGMVDFFKKALRKCKKLKERILLGSDWWIVTGENIFKRNGYHNYLSNIYQQIAKLDDKDMFSDLGIKNQYELLAYFSVLNPVRFLQLKKHCVKIAAAYKANAKSEHSEFALEKWISDAPEKISDLYK